VGGLGVICGTGEQIPVYAQSTVLKLQALLRGVFTFRYTRCIPMLFIGGGGEETFFS
jgi:hypothetical protein